MIQARPVNKGLLISLLPHVILLVTGIILTYFAHIKHQESIDNKIISSLNNRLSSISTGINSRLDLYQYGLFGLKGFVHGIGASNLNYQAISNYSGSRNYAKEFPGANGIGYIKKVGVEQLNNFLNDAKNDRPDQTFNLNTLVATSDEHFIIQYIFPEQKNLQAIGLDIGSESMRKQAALNAAINNTTQLTAPLTLVQASKLSHQGFLILVPIYKTITISDNKKQRLNELLGWAYSPLLIDKILDSLSHIDENQLTISDLNNSTETDFFSYGIKSTTNDYQLTKIIKLMGRTWKITINASDAFIYNLHLPSQYQAIVNGSFATIGCMFIAFLMQLFIFRRSQRIKRKTLQAKKNKLALQQTNLKLEKEVKLRTKEIADISMLQQSILNSASYSIIATDINGLITLFNPASEKLLGYKAQDVIGIENPGIFHLKEEIIKKAKQLSAELNEPVFPGFEVFILKATATEPDINQWTYISSTGEHIQVNISVTSLLNNENEIVGYLGVAYDLTEQINHEQALGHAKELAEQASQAKSEFLANMSHEIRTPMNGILGTLQLLQEQPLNEKSKEYLKKSLYSTRSLTTIINDILDFSKIEAGKLSLEYKSFDLFELIHHLESDLGLQASDKNIYLKFIINIEHKYWVGDPVRLRQIFLNLISNAIKFTSQGGVTVTFRLTDENKICCCISDTGIGISEQAIERLFERFEQAEQSTTREYGGTGLGLPITKSLIGLMNGEIKVTSQLDSGSQFYVYLPLKQAQIDESTLITKNVELPDLSGKTILLAEDNKINQLVASAMLEPTKATIIIANNGLEAISLYESHKPDIIFMDIQMPKMDGLQACKKIKALNSEQIVIALTANVFTEQKEIYRQLFDGYVSKPIEKHELVGMLSTLYLVNS
ncbi:MULTISPECIES: CHASE domain-containing protein [Pseudoalteromonas]|uniref:CHASE domain-containing protein n=2 Tax=Pseudoalteromonas TaxID=53246 RepID=UPI000C32E8BC|nr:MULTISPECIES: CHASE domain-containing protein [Pseudoalteromonas]PKG66295.1 hybrid sensor histidine kinase/response regulator [Pseudoalteromonas arctica]PKG69416.1 hybrid sensor histidine kinase/response regulator [Pseudoalteromonas sp. GutCa3]